MVRRAYRLSELSKSCSAPWEVWSCARRELKSSFFCCLLNCLLKPSSLRNIFGPSDPMISMNNVSKPSTIVRQSRNNLPVLCQSLLESTANTAGFSSNSAVKISRMDSLTDNRASSSYCKATRSLSIAAAPAWISRR